MCHNYKQSVWICNRQLGVIENYQKYRTHKSGFLFHISEPERLLFQQSSGSIEVRVERAFPFRWTNAWREVPNLLSKSIQNELIVQIIMSTALQKSVIGQSQVTDVWWTSKYFFMKCVCALCIIKIELSLMQRRSKSFSTVKIWNTSIAIA